MHVYRITCILHRCQDDCGQVVPFQSAGSTNVSEEEIVLSSQAFAQVLDAQWDIGSCDNDVVIFFVEEYGEVSPIWQILKDTY